MSRIKITKQLRIFVGLLFLGFTPSARASSGPVLNCYIRIQTMSVSGEKKKITFGTRLNSRQECRALAGLHKPNFEPQLVSQKKVGYRWKNKA